MIAQEPARRPARCVEILIDGFADLADAADFLTSLAPWTIHAGVPSRLIRTRSRELLGLEGQIAAIEARNG